MTLDLFRLLKLCRDDIWQTTLPRTMTKEEVVRVHTAWKEKLGTRAFGLNLN